jgi:hypothetical protein
MDSAARKSFKLGFFHTQKNFKDLLIVALQLAVSVLPLIWAIHYTMQKLLPQKAIIAVIQEMHSDVTFSSIVLEYLHHAPMLEILSVIGFLLGGILIFTFVVSSAFVDISRSVADDTPINRMVLTKVFGKVELNYFKHLLWMGIVVAAIVALNSYVVFLFVPISVNILTSAVILGYLAWLILRMSLGFVSVAVEEGFSVKDMFAASAHKLWDTTHVYLLWLCLFFPLGFFFRFISHVLETASAHILVAGTHPLISGVLQGGFYAFDFAQIFLQTLGLILLVAAVAHLYQHHKNLEKKK